MNFKEIVFLSSIIALFFSGCSKSEIEPKCTTKVLTHKEFQQKFHASKR